MKYRVTGIVKKDGWPYPTKFRFGTRLVKTDHRGIFRIDNIPVGDYDVTIETYTDNISVTEDIIIDFNL